MPVDMPFLDPDLFRRYDRPGPRYTSYPAAPRFHDGFGESALREAAVASNGDPIPRRLSLYVHVPFCTGPCFDGDCHRAVTGDESRVEGYLLRQYREIGMMAGLFDRDRDVIQCHFGGGTRNFLSPAQLDEFMDSLRRHFHFSEAQERDISIELDPRFVTPGGIAELAATGFNRASLRVQDRDPDLQAPVYRRNGAESILAIIQACRDHGMRSVNVDLVYGLPKQTPEGFARTLDIVARARPDRLAFHGYAHLPHLSRARRQTGATELPGAEERLGLLQLAISKLDAAGYVHIGMEHFALPDDDLALAQACASLHRNFMGYTAHAESDLIGLGVSAISHVGDTFSQNHRDLASWQRAIDDGCLPVCRGMRMDEDDCLRADLIQCLMCRGEVPVASLERRYSIDFEAYFADSLARLAPLAADGLVVLERGRVAATTRGRLLLRNIAMCFDRYLEPGGAGPRPAPPRHSRAIWRQGGCRRDRHRVPPRR